MSAANALGSPTIIVQDFRRSPVSRFFHSSHRPAAVSSSEPSRAVKYHGCLPSAVSCHSECPHIGIRQRRRLNGSRKKGLVVTVSTRALKVASRSSLSGLLHQNGT